MKDLNVLKKLLVLCSIVFTSTLYADELSSILSENKELLFDYDFKSNELQSDMLSKSWINPVQVRYGKDYTTRFKTGTIDTSTFSVFIDQPIFRSGGIYYANISLCLVITAPIGTPPPKPFASVIMSGSIS